MLTAGAEYRNEKGRNKGNFDDSVNNRALYLNNKLKLFKDSLILNTGLRYDNHETAGSKTTYRVGALYDIKPVDLKIKGSYGTGFRAPSLNDLFYPFYGNLTLKPEETTAWDIGLEKGIMKDRATLSLTYFEQRYKNLIQTDPMTWLAANIARAEVKGIEADAVLKLTSNVNVKAGYTYLDAKDKDTNQRLTRRPQDKFGFGADYLGKDMSLGASYTFVSERYDSSVRRDLTSYHLVNMSGSYKLTKWPSIFGRVENLFDANYEEAGSYKTPGFSIYGGIRIATL
ncbi:MAG: TonB-dependent receptor [Nitrospirae bacterium]|nr:TonB-dependent receptor [Nitrospirota bacterium]